MSGHGEDVGEAMVIDSEQEGQEQERDIIAPHHDSDPEMLMDSTEAEMEMETGVGAEEGVEGIRGVVLGATGRRRRPSSFSTPSDEPPSTRHKLSRPKLGNSNNSSNSGNSSSSSFSNPNFWSDQITSTTSGSVTVPTTTTTATISSTSSLTTAAAIASGSAPAPVCSVPTGNNSVLPVVWSSTSDSLGLPISAASTGTGHTNLAPPLLWQGDIGGSGVGSASSTATDAVSSEVYFSPPSRSIQASPVGRTGSGGSSSQSGTLAGRGVSHQHPEIQELGASSSASIFKLNQDVLNQIISQISQQDILDLANLSLTCRVFFRLVKSRISWGFAELRDASEFVFLDPGEHGSEVCLQDLATTTTMSGGRDRERSTTAVPAGPRPSGGGEGEESKLPSHPDESVLPSGLVMAADSPTSLTTPIPQPQTHHEDTAGPSTSSTPSSSSSSSSPDLVRPIFPPRFPHQGTIQLSGGNTYVPFLGVQPCVYTFNPASYPWATTPPTAEPKASRTARTKARTKSKTTNGGGDSSIGIWEKKLVNIVGLSPGQRWKPYSGPATGVGDRWIYFFGGTIYEIDDGSLLSRTKSEPGNLSSTAGTGDTPSSVPPQQQRKQQEPTSPSVYSKRDMEAADAETDSYFEFHGLAAARANVADPIPPTFPHPTVAGSSKTPAKRPSFGQAFSAPTRPRWKFPEWSSNFLSPGTATNTTGSGSGSRGPRSGGTGGSIGGSGSGSGSGTGSSGSSSNETVKELWSNSMWRLDVKTWELYPVIPYASTTKVSNSIDPDLFCPPPLRYHSLSTVDDRWLVVFGGVTEGSEGENSTYIFDLLTHTWLPDPIIHGIPPQIRFSHATSVISNHLFIFGGARREPVGLVHVYWDLHRLTCTQYGFIWEHFASPVRGKVQTSSTTPPEPLTSDPEDKKISTTGLPPHERVGAGLVVANNRRILVFGGRTVDENKEPENSINMASGFSSPMWDDIFCYEVSCVDCLDLDHLHWSRVSVPRQGNLDICETYLREFVPMGPHRVLGPQGSTDGWAVLIAGSKFDTESFSKHIEQPLGELSHLLGTGTNPPTVSTTTSTTASASGSTSTLMANRPVLISHQSFAGSEQSESSTASFISPPMGEISTASPKRPTTHRTQSAIAGAFITLHSREGGTDICSTEFYIPRTTPQTSTSLVPPRPPRPPNERASESDSAVEVARAAYGAQTEASLRKGKHPLAVGLLVRPFMQLLVFRH